MGSLSNSDKSFPGVAIRSQNKLRLITLTFSVPCQRRQVEYLHTTYVFGDGVPASDLHPLMVEPLSGPQRSRPASMTPGRADKEKRKRSRVTPEQLVHLERLFALDRSPTAARRKEISDMLGMQERQTQIWFQNRRAKAKLQEGKKCRGNSTETPPVVPPELATGYEAELQNLLHEDEPVTIIPCTDLSVGTWRRIATSLRKHDLVAYLCESRRCLTWYIHSSGYGFKMEIPFDVIVDTEFTNATSESALASFILSQPPTFYLDSFSPPHAAPGTTPVRYWKKCADWTEDQQATKVLRHNLVGSAAQLAHVLHLLNAHKSESDVRPHSRGYHSQSQKPSPTLLEDSSSPGTPAIFAGTGYYYHSQDSVDLRQPDHQILTREGSFSSPVPCQQHSLPDGSAHLPVAQPSSSVVPESDPPIYAQYSQHPGIEVRQSTPYANTAVPYHISQASISDHGSSRSFSPHNSHQRPYSAGSVHSRPYQDDNRILFLPDSLQPLGNTPPHLLGAPLLLTTPFYSA